MMLELFYIFLAFYVLANMQNAEEMTFRHLFSVLRATMNSVTYAFHKERMHPASHDRQNT